MRGSNEHDMLISALDLPIQYTSQWYRARAPISTDAQTKQGKTQSTKN